MKAIITFLILFNTTAEQPVISQTPVKEQLFLTLERTPCFGKCPSYKITIFNTGNVIYEGFTFAKKEGKYTKKLASNQLTEIKNKMKEIGFFSLKDKYDAMVTDIPSCIIVAYAKGKKKKVLDRVNAPEKLKQLEKLIDAMIIDEQLIKQPE